MSCNADRNTNITNLGWDRIFHTAQLLYGSVEIVSVANNDAHYKLQTGLHTGVKRKLKTGFTKIKSKLTHGHRRMARGFSHLPNVSAFSSNDKEKRNWKRKTLKRPPPVWSVDTSQDGLFLPNSDLTMWMLHHKSRLIRPCSIFPILLSCYVEPM